MIPGPKYFGAHTMHLTEEYEDISYVVICDGKSVAYSSMEVAQATAAYHRKQGHTDVSVEVRRATLRCGEVYY